VPKAARQPVLLALLVVVAALAFVPAVTSSFVADDFILLRTLGRYGGVGWAFTHNDLGAGSGAGHFYRPLWVLWHAGIDRLSGAAWAFHVGNLVLYVAITLEVWLLGRRLLGARSAWVAAFAFAVYPRHGESVSWVSGSTDLVAAALGLPAILCALAAWRPWVRAGAAASFAAAAALSKESAFVLPLLALVVVWAARGPKRRWVAPIAMAVAQAAVLVARHAVVGGLGGYSDYPWTPLRFLVGLGSYVLASLSPPQFELLRDPALLAVPIAALGFVFFAARSLRRRGERERLRLAAAGALWFGIALLPALNLAVDLNAGNGERLLFLPSVGLAIGLGALVPIRSNATLVSLVSAGIGALALSLYSAQTWNPAGDLAERVVSQAAALGPSNGELVVLTVPEEYRNAHVFPGETLAVALARAGRGDLRVAECVPVIVRTQTAGAVRASRRADGGFDIKTTWDVPVDVPVLRDPTSVSADCVWDAPSGWPPGIALSATVKSTPSRQPAAVGYFDGRDLVSLP
jgi:hypothetical protein